MEELLIFLGGLLVGFGFGFGQLWAKRDQGRGYEIDLVNQKVGDIDELE